MLRLPPARLLVVKLGSIGDVVNTLPLVNVLKRSWPESELRWLIEPKSHPIVAGHEAVDRFIVFRREERLRGVRAALAEIREYAPDLVIDLQRILRSGFFTFFSGASIQYSASYYRFSFDSLSTSRTCLT
jgi:ADP-heptose:LPS heptosyltransferase